jgi:hypothetical protein
VLGCERDDLLVHAMKQRIGSHNQCQGNITAIVVAPGTSSRIISNRLASRVWVTKVMPVRLPPGRLTLATRPSRTGSLPVTKTVGTVSVAALATTAETVVIAAIKLTRC